MSAMPAEEDPVDWGKCEQVKTAIEKIMALDPPSIAWMTAELAHHLQAAQYSAYTMIQMELIKRGIHPQEAMESAQQQAPLLAFQLGMQVGAEIESTRAMRELFGE